MSNRPDSYWDSADEQTKHMAGILFNHRRFMPWYDDMADYNTDAKSYYDYLARHNAILDAFVDLLNRLLRRELLVNDTVTGKMTQNGTWEEVDDIIIKTDVAVSKNTLDGYANAIKIDSDMNTGGLIAKDFTDEIAGIHNDIDNINNQLNNLDSKVDKIINNLIDSGGWTGDADNGDVTEGMHIAYGNRNWLMPDNNGFIKTHKGDIDGDMMGGI